jgi:carbon monoxide dehydrogenase subunit G
MSTLSISRRFQVAAPPERVWAYLTTPELVVTCLPGAALTSSAEDGRTHDGTVTVKLGAMSVSYRGTATFEEVDNEARRMRVLAKGREKTGAGSAEMTMLAEVVDSGASTSEVALEATAKVSGKIVTLGRGMIEIVSEQVLSEFASCLSAMLAGDAADHHAPGTDRDGVPTADAHPSPNVLALLWRALRTWVGKLFRRG